MIAERQETDEAVWQAKIREAKGFLAQPFRIIFLNCYTCCFHAKRPDQFAAMQGWSLRWLNRFIFFAIITWWKKIATFKIYLYVNFCCINFNYVQSVSCFGGPTESIEITDWQSNSCTAVCNCTYARWITIGHYFLIVAGLLFHRSVLMSGSALSPWALVRGAANYALQVAKHLNCSWVSIARSALH